MYTVQFNRVGPFIQFEIEFYFQQISGKFLCNRAHRKILCMRSFSSRNTTTITCDCNWDIRFRGVDRSNFPSISLLSGSHSNVCHPSYVEQFVLSQTYSEDYKRCTAMRTRKASCIRWQLIFCRSQKDERVVKQVFTSQRVY